MTNVGIGNLLNTAVTIWDRESKLEAAEVDVKFLSNAKLGDLPVEAVQLTHLKHLRDVKFHMSRVYFDKDPGSRCGPSASDGRSSRGKSLRSWKTTSTRS